MKKDWEIKELAAVSAINYGYTESASSEPVGPRFLRITDIQNDGVDWENVPYCKIAGVDTSKYRLASGDIVFARTGATTGKSFLVNEPPDAVFASYLIRLRLLDKKLLPEFVSLFFQTDGYWKSIKDGSVGSAQGGFNATKLGALSIPVPPLTEQRHLVGIIDEAFEGIAIAKAKAEKNLQNVRALFESHLQSIFTQRGKGWVERRLGDVVTRLTNGYVGPTRNIYHNSGVPYLLARHVKNNRLLFDGRTFISDEFNRKNKKSMLKAGDVLLVQSGHIGHSAVVTEEHEGHNCHAMIVISPVKDALTGPFLSLYFNSSEMRQRFDQIRSGSTVPHLTCGAVKELIIPLPDLVTQQRLIDHSQELQTETQRLAGLFGRKLAVLDALKRSLLNKAFSGEL